MSRTTAAGTQEIVKFEKSLIFDPNAMGRQYG
jgi:hypothetical protein